MGEISKKVQAINSKHQQREVGKYAAAAAYNFKVSS